MPFMYIKGSSLKGGVCMNTRKDLYDIIGGPNRDLLFDACKYAYDKSVSVLVEFSVVVGYTKPKDDPGRANIMMRMADVKVVGIQHEDGSGDSFNIVGYCRADVDILGKMYPYRFEAYYNVKTRSGSIGFISNKP